jgi:glycosyltransferase involved in cell wall biosynthesis
VKLLVLSPILPHAPVDGDRMRVWHWLRLLKARGHQLGLACFVRSRAELSPQRTEALRGLLSEGLHAVALPGWRIKANAASAFFGHEPFNVAAYASPAMRALAQGLAAQGGFDATLAYRLRMAPYALGLGLPAALDYCDAMSAYALQRYEQAGAGSLAQAYWGVEQGRLMGYEASLTGRFGASFTNGEGDRRYLASLQAGGAGLSSLPNGVDFDYHHPDESQPRDPLAVCFVGQLGYAPNWQAALEFGSQSLPRVRRALPGAHLFLVGGGAPKALAPVLEDRSVLAPGFVQDVRPWVQRSAVALCTVRTATGIQNKLLEAMALGTPVVASPLAARAVGALDGRHLLVAEGPAAAAEAVIRLLKDPALGRALAAEALAFVRRGFEWEQSGALLDAALRSLKGV